MCAAKFLIPHIHKYKEIYKFVNVWNLIFIIFYNVSLYSAIVGN